MIPEKTTDHEKNIRAEYEKRKYEPTIYEDGRINHSLIGLSALVGFMDGLSNPVEIDYRPMCYRKLVNKNVPRG